MSEPSLHRVLRERPQYHVQAFVMSAVLTALLALAVQQSGGGWPEARMGGLLAYNLLSVIAGLLCYLSWRITPRSWLAWLTVVVLGVSLAETPFMMMGFVAEPAGAVPGGELQEVVTVWVVAGALVAAARGLPMRGLQPLGAAVATGLVLALIRAAGVRWGPDTLDPVSALGIVQRLVIATAMVVMIHAVWRLDELDRRLRVTYLAILLSTSTFALNDTGIDWLGPAWGVIVTVFFMVGLAQVQVEAAITLVMRALVQRQQEITALAVRAATARAMVDRGAELLDAVRSSVGPLARASRVLEETTSLPAENRDVLAAAMRRELERVNRSLGDDGRDPEPFELDDIVGPLVDFQRAQGLHVLWHPSGLAAVHDPDTVARALGVSLSVVADAVGGEDHRVIVRTAVSPREGEPLYLQVLPSTLHDRKHSSVFLQEGLFLLPASALSTVRSVERLLQNHGGGLRLLLPAAPEEETAARPASGYGATGYGLELTLPLHQGSRSRPLTR